MKKTFKRMVTCIFSALLTVNSVMPAYANEQPISEPLSSTLNVSVIGSGQVKVTENGNETVVTTETPFSQSYAEGTNVKIEAIATEGNVIENFTNNDVAVPEFVAEQNSIKKLNIVTEPVSIQELYQFLNHREFFNEISEKPLQYNLKTKHAEIFGGKNGYIFTKNYVLNDLENFLRKKHET